MKRKQKILFIISFILFLVISIFFLVGIIRDGYSAIEILNNGVVHGNSDFISLWILKIIIFLLLVLNSILDLVHINKISPLTAVNRLISSVVGLLTYFSAYFLIPIVYYDFPTDILVRYLIYFIVFLVGLVLSIIALCLRKEEYYRAKLVLISISLLILTVATAFTVFAIFGLIFIVICGILFFDKNHSKKENHEDSDTKINYIEIIKKYKQLLDDNIITEAEYNKLKKKLLDKVFDR